MTQLKDGGCQPSNREERSLSASTAFARWQGNGWDEPCKSRGLRTVLWAAGGEIPPADPAASSFRPVLCIKQTCLTHGNARLSTELSSTGSGAADRSKYWLWCSNNSSQLILSSWKILLVI